MKKQETHFDVEGTTIRGVFHLPEGEQKDLPIVVMGNGYATEWQFGTDGFIKAFTDAGWATLNFDYRNFGQSDGEPRQLLDIPGQLVDFRAAIAHAKQQRWVDATKLVIWGSSLGGGHALSMGAEHPDALAVIAQVPHCDSRAAFKTVALSAVFKGMSKAIADSIGALFGAKPILLPVLAEPENYGVMNHPGWYKSYQVLSESSLTWRNAIPARSLLKGGDYRPIAVAENIRCPVLLVPAKADAGVPLDSVQETANKIAKAEIFAIEGDHFGVYYGEYLPSVLEKQVDFIRQQLAKA